MVHFFKLTVKTKTVDSLFDCRISDLPEAHNLKKAWWSRQSLWPISGFVGPLQGVPQADV
jgi:hypothetical protein